MLETIAIPILKKAIDFVFEEGRRILRERRERRQHSEGAETPAGSSQRAENRAMESPNLPAPTKNAALKLVVDEALWKIHEARIQHLVELAEINTRNYHLAKVQHAKWGSALVPPIVLNNLEEAENAVAEAMAELTSALREVYRDRQLPSPNDAE